jgi:hypothetical protein
MVWIYKDSAVNSHEDLLPGCTDIVYELKFSDGRKYIGKKAVRAFRKCPPLKGKKRSRRILKDLPFIKYEGSHGVATAVVVKKTILYQCSTRKASTYIECALLFGNNAIFEKEYVNQNISGKFFDSDLDGLLDQ